MEFEAAWHRSIHKTSPLPGAPPMRFHNGPDSTNWREAFEATKEGWRAAYAREPDAPVEGLVRITPILGELSLTAA